MDWTVEDNMVDGLFFCATLTGRRGGHAYLCKQDTGAVVVKPYPGSSWEGHSRRVGASVRDENAKSCVVVRPLHILLVIRPVCHTDVVVRKTDELLCGG